MNREEEIKELENLIGGMPIDKDFNIIFDDAYSLFLSKEIAEYVIDAGYRKVRVNVEVCDEK